MRKLFIKLEKWVFEDESSILSGIKFLLVIGAFVVTIVSVIGFAVATIDPDDRVVLDLTTDWDCTSAHTELQRVMHGKISRLEDVVVCDNYRKRIR